MGGEISGDGFGKSGVELETHLRELDADVGVELKSGDLVEELVVDACRAMSLFRGVDALTEGIKGNVHALPVDVLSDAHGVVNGESCDETRAELCANAGLLAEAADGAIAREGDECRTEEWHRSLGK